MNGIKSSSSLVLKINDLPFGGSCNVDPYNGTALNTNFTIVCNNWQDSDGYIAKYEYFGNFEFYDIFILDL